VRSAGDDIANLIIPAFDANGQTLSLVIDLHPGLFRMLSYVLSCYRFPFRDRDAAIRWCIAHGLHALLGPPLSSFVLKEVKMNIFKDDQFQRQEDYLAISVEKELGRRQQGKCASARRAID